MKHFVLNPDSHSLEHPLKCIMAMLGSRMIGLPASGLTILGLQLLDGLARELMLRGWWHPLRTLPTIQHTWFGTFCLRNVDWIKSSNRKI